MHVCLSIKNNLSRFFLTQLWAMELYSAENRHIVPQFLVRKKMQLEL